VSRRPVSAASEPVRQTLANGLIVIVQERPSADVAALQHTALAGFRDDGAIQGVTVLTSRMLLAGTDRRPSDIAMQTAANLAGGSLTRATTAEVSNIICAMPADSAELAFDLVSDAVANPLFSPSGFQSQQALALQGIAQRHTDPSLLMNDLYQQSIFAGQPLGFPPLGTAETVAAMSLDDIRSAYQRLFGAANGVVTVAGRIQAADAFRLANQYFGQIATGQANTRQATQVHAPATPEVVQGTAGQHQIFRVGFLAADLRDPDRYPLAVLTGLMTGFSGRLVRELRTKRGLSYTPDAGYLPYSDAGAWYAEASVDPDNLNEALDITRAQIQQLLDETAGSSEVSDAIDAISGEEILANESNAAVANQLATQQILGDISTTEFVSRVQTVTPADVQRVAKKYLQLDHALTILVGPQASS
jgi:predicted Zn-dependent peptidase